MGNALFSGFPVIKRKEADIKESVNLDKIINIVNYNLGHVQNVKSSIICFAQNITKYEYGEMIIYEWKQKLCESRKSIFESYKPQNATIKVNVSNNAIFQIEAIYQNGTIYEVDIKNNKLHGNFSKTLSNGKTELSAKFDNGKLIYHRSPRNELEIFEEKDIAIMKLYYTDGVLRYSFEEEKYINQVRREIVMSNVHYLRTISSYDKRANAFIQELKKYDWNGNLNIHYCNNETLLEMKLIENRSECPLGKVITLCDDMNDNHILDEGMINVWKAGIVETDEKKINVYIKILVLDKVERVSCVSKDCTSRIEWGITEDIFDDNGNPYKEAYSNAYGKKFTYTVGEFCEPDKYDPDPLNGYSHGINVFKYKESCTTQFRAF